MRGIEKGVNHGFREGHAVHPLDAVFRSPFLFPTLVEDGVHEMLLLVRELALELQISAMDVVLAATLVLDGLPCELLNGKMLQEFLDERRMGKWLAVFQDAGERSVLGRKL